MIQWTENFAGWRRPLGWLRLMSARSRWADEDRFRLINLWGTRRCRRCFILGNGPSLSRMDLSPLKGEITIGSNGVYQLFREWGWWTTYLLATDIAQTERRARDLARVAAGRSTVLVGLPSAYAFPVRPWASGPVGCGVTFLNVRLPDQTFDAMLRPRFSDDFADVVYTGGSVTYVALQLALWLGCDPIYLVGVDHDYGTLNSPGGGRVRVNATALDLLRGRHFAEGYWRAGDLMNLPDVARMTESYRHARRVLELHGRRVYNAGVGGKLEVFERVKFEDLFTTEDTESAEGRVTAWRGGYRSC